MLLGTGAGCGGAAFEGTVAPPLALRSLRKVEKAGEERSMRVRSVKRVFSAESASLEARSSSASLTLAAISPSSCPIYSGGLVSGSLET